MGGAAAHFFEHGGAAGAEEADQQGGGEEQEDDVEDGGVVPGDGGLGDLGVSFGGNQPEAAEGELDDVGGRDHGGVEDGQQGEHHLGAVVLPVDDQDRDDDQVGEDERDDTAEADAPVPQHARQGHVADRADEADHRDHRSDEGPPQLGGDRVAGEEQVLPEGVGHPGGHGPGDQQADDHVADDGGPLHHEDVADGGVPLPGGQPVPEAPAGGDAHVHRRVALHGSGQALVRLLPRRVDQALAHEQAERHGHADDHYRAADELGQRELPADQQREDDAELDDQVGAGDLEDHRGGEAGPLAEQRTGERHRRVGAGRGRGAQAGGPGQGRRPVVTEHGDDRLPPDQRLHNGRQREAEDERPGDLPGHRASLRQRMADGGKHG